MQRAVHGCQGFFSTNPHFWQIPLSEWNIKGFGLLRSQSPQNDFFRAVLMMHVVSSPGTKVMQGAKLTGQKFRAVSGILACAFAVKLHTAPTLNPTSHAPWIVNCHRCHEQKQSFMCQRGARWVNLSQLWLVGIGWVSFVVSQVAVGVGWQIALRQSDLSATLICTREAGGSVHLTYRRHCQKQYRIMNLKPKHVQHLHWYHRNRMPSWWCSTKSASME